MDELPSPRDLWTSPARASSPGRCSRFDVEVPIVLITRHRDLAIELRIRFDRRAAAAVGRLANRPSQVAHREVQGAVPLFIVGVCGH
jgi:hypothetical protein